VCRHRLALGVGIVLVLCAAPVAAQKRPKPNQPPNVTLSSPSNGATFQEPATIVVSANANDTDGSIVQVDFYAGQTWIGVDSKKPYSATWTGARAGTYVLTAIARDDSGATTTSAPRTMTVTSGSATSTPDITAPTVAITAPAAGAQVSGSVTISATASDNIGVRAVTFLVDGSAVGSDTASPYSVTWDAATAAAGSHTLVARATDAAGNVGTSASELVSVATSSGVG
jgi:hypothetical protein